MIKFWAKQKNEFSGIQIIHFKLMKDNYNQEKKDLVNNKLKYDDYKNRDFFNIN